MEQTQNLLIVDDNAEYKQMIEALYQDQNYNIDWAKSAKEGNHMLDEKGMDHYQAIVTDITMESQTSGLSYALSLRKKGFSGKITIASTGFDYKIVIFFAKPILCKMGIDYLIPKVSLKKGDPQIIACKK